MDSDSKASNITKHKLAPALKVFRGGATSMVDDCRCVQATHATRFVHPPLHLPTLPSEYAQSLAG